MRGIDPRRAIDAATVPVIQIASGAVHRTSQDKINEVISVKDFGAVGDGSTDDTTAIQSAINKAAETGAREVFLPAGNYVISSSLSIGDGTATAWATYGGISLTGDGSGGNRLLAGGNTVYTTRISSSHTGYAVTINGPISGWGIKNLAITFTTTASTAGGLNVIGGQNGSIQNLYVESPPHNGILIQARESYTGSGTPGAYWNNWQNVSVYLHANYTSNGIVIGGGAFDRYFGVAISPNSTTSGAHTCIWLKDYDNADFYNVHCLGLTANPVSIKFDYSNGVDSQYPSDCRFYGMEPGGGSISNVGTPSTGATPNRIFGLSRTNGASLPHIANLEVINSAGQSKAFILLNSAQNMGSPAAKVQLDTVIFDNDQISDTSTNYRLTPIRNGYYLINGQVSYNGATGGPSLCYALLYKNGSQIAASYLSNDAISATPNFSMIVSCNGATDYVELYGLSNGGTVALNLQDTYLTLIGPF